MTPDPKKYKRLMLGIGKVSNWTEGAKLQQEAEQQYNATRAYVNSPMYSQRLASMVEREKQLVNGSKFRPGILQRMMVMGRTPDIVNQVVATNNRNLNDVSNRVFVNNNNLGPNVIAQYDSSQNRIDLNEKGIKGQMQTFGHELSHATNKNIEPYSDSFKEKFVSPLMVKKSAPNYDPYVQRPTEVKARLDAIRMLAEKEGIYDAKKEVFSPQHLQKMLINKNIGKSSDWLSIVDQLDKSKWQEGLMWLMNNVAKNKEVNKGGKFDMPGIGLAKMLKNSKDA